MGLISTSFSWATIRVPRKTWSRRWRKRAPRAASPQLDARLRPDGEKGPLVCSLETLRNYYETRAQFWELQALTRARAISWSVAF